MKASCYILFEQKIVSDTAQLKKPKWFIASL